MRNSNISYKVFGVRHYSNIKRFESIWADTPQATRHLEAIKQSSEFWAAWVTTDAADSRKVATKAFASHVVMSEFENVARMGRRIDALDTEVRNLKGMHAGRKLKREGSEPA